jgi:hypothetical protein
LCNSKQVAQTRKHVASRSENDTKDSSNPIFASPHLAHFAGSKWPNQPPKSRELRVGIKLQTVLAGSTFRTNKMDEDLTKTMPDSHLAFQPANHVGSHDLGLTSSSEQKHEDLFSGMAVKSVAIQLAHVVRQLRVVVEDVAHESIDARSRVLHPLHKETISGFQNMSIYQLLAFHNTAKQESNGVRPKRRPHKYLTKPWTHGQSLKPS